MPHNSISESHEKLDSINNTIEIFFTLTKAEREVLEKLHQGKGLKEIAHELWVSEGAIKQRHKNAKIKCKSLNTWARALYSEVLWITQIVSLVYDVPTSHLLSWKTKDNTKNKELLLLYIKNLRKTTSEVWPTLVTQVQRNARLWVNNALDSNSK